jgi:hypothetical protein
VADDGTAGTEQPRGAGDRRGSDRRRVERRNPPPLWRRPAAFVAYGAVAVLLLVWLTRGGKDEPADVSLAPVAPAPPQVDTTATVVRPGTVQDAMRTADFERLILEGERAAGRVVRAQLYCDAPTPVALQGTSDTLEAAIAPLVDSASQRVPAAECLWGAQDDPRRGEFLLLVPPSLAAQFAAQPVLMEGFVRRRRVIARVAWVGKSRAMALQTVGIYQGNAP